MSDESHNTVSAPGASLIGKLTKLVVDGNVYAKRGLGDHTASLGRQIFTDVTNHVSDEVRSVMGPYFKELAESPDMPDQFKPLFRQLASGRGQAWAWIGGTVTGAVMGGGLQNLITNELNGLILPIIANNPHGILSPSDVAAAQARGIETQYDPQKEAAKSGISSDRFEVLTQLAHTRLDPGTVIDAYRRHELSFNEAVEYLVRNGYTHNDAGHMMNLSPLPLTARQASEMVNRNVITHAEGEQIAALTGVNRLDFERIALVTGDPLSPQELGEAYRRGFIDKARFNHGIIQGPLRNEWFDILEKLQYRRMTPVDAADAVNQGHLSDAEGKAIAEANGLDATDFETLLKTAGTPPGIQFTIDALNRGIIDQPTFDQIFLESRIKNRYLPLIRDMRYNLIPRETLLMLYRKGAVTEEYALNILEKHGFTPEDAAIQLSAEKSHEDTSTKELTRAEIVDMYEQRMISKDTALQFLEGLRYGHDVALAQLELADLKRLRTFIASALNRIKAAYVAGRIDESTANGALDQLGIAPDQKDDVLKLWDIERTTVRRTLTVAQIGQAYDKGFISEGDALLRLGNEGYDDVDADLVLKLMTRRRASG